MFSRDSTMGHMQVAALSFETGFSFETNELISEFWWFAWITLELVFINPRNIFIFSQTNSSRYDNELCLQQIHVRQSVFFSIIRSWINVLCAGFTFPSNVFVSFRFIYRAAFASVFEFLLLLAWLVSKTEYKIHKRPLVESF